MSNKIININKTKNTPLPKKGSLTGNTLYEANQQIMAQMKPMPEPELASKYTPLEDWFNMIIDTYAMLLCHDKRDYTIFHLYEKENPNPPAVATRELIACLKERGEILSIDLNSDKAWEIWLRIDKTPYCYYLFRYDNAVIEC